MKDKKQTERVDDCKDRKREVMCNLSQGFVDMGRREGRTEGEQRMGVLMSQLLSSGKTEEAMKASSNPEYRNQLYKQYNL